MQIYGEIIRAEKQISGQVATHLPPDRLISKGLGRIRGQINPLVFFFANPIESYINNKYFNIKIELTKILARLI